LTIYMQHESPGPDKEPNWLPTPARDFRPVMRMYQPKPEIPYRGLPTTGHSKVR
jgi:hypothetical protein